MQYVSQAAMTPAEAATALFKAMPPPITHSQLGEYGIEAAEAQVRASQAREEQAAAKIESAVARQKQVEARLLAGRKRVGIASQALSRGERIYRGCFLARK